MPKTSTPPNPGNPAGECEAVLSEVLARAHKSLQEFDRADRKAEDAMVQAMETGDGPALRQIVECYGDRTVYDLEILEFRLARLCNKSPLTAFDALSLFPQVYRALDVVPEAVVVKREFGQMLAALRQGRANFDSGLCAEGSLTPLVAQDACGTILEALTKKVLQRPLVDRVWGRLNASHHYGGSLLSLVAHYRHMHKRIREMWKRMTPGDPKRFDLLYREFKKEYPNLQRVIEKDLRYENEISPEYIAFMLIANRIESIPGSKTANAQSLRRERARAGKIRKALNAIGGDDLPLQAETDFDPWGYEILLRTLSCHHPTAKRHTKR